jgi:3-dehydroquinate dehydratase-2
MNENRASDRPRLAVLFGANLNMLGRRNPVFYGTMTLDDVWKHVRAKAEELDVELETFQANIEGELVNWVHEHRDQLDGYVVNPGGFTMFGQAFRDAIVDTGSPLVELHFSNIHARGIVSIWSEQAVGQICGFHWRGAVIALDVLNGIVRAGGLLPPRR